MPQQVAAAKGFCRGRCCRLDLTSYWGPGFPHAACSALSLGFVISSAPSAHPVVLPRSFHPLSLGLHGQSGVTTPSSPYYFLFLPLPPILRAGFFYLPVSHSNSLNILGIQSRLPLCARCWREQLTLVPFPGVPSSMVRLTSQPRASCIGVGANQ